MVSLKSEQIAELEKYYRINLINGLNGYKSLNLLGTVNGEGNSNLCLINSVFHLGSQPPLLGLVMRPQREHNDTLRNIKSTGSYTLNNVLPDFYPQAHQTSASYPLGVSEFNMCGFKELYLEGFKAPFVAQSTIKIGLELQELIDMKINGTTIVVGKIDHILINNDVLEPDGFVNHIKAETMTVSGLDAYYLPHYKARLDYAKPGVEPRN